MSVTSNFSKILTAILALGPKAPEVIAILRRMYADGQRLITLLFPEGLPSLSSDPLPDGTLGLTLHETFSEEDLALEGQVLALLAEQSAEAAGDQPLTQEIIQAGGLLKILAFLERTGLADAFLGYLADKFLSKKAA